LIQDNWDIYLQESCRSQRVIWKLAPLRQEKLAVLRRIFRKGLEIVKGDLNNISFGHIADMIKLVREGQVHGEVHLPAGLRCKLGYCDFILERAKEEESLDDYSITLQIPGEAWIPGCERKITAVRLDRGEGTLPRGQSKAWVDARHAGPSLLVRNRRPGDRFRPLGMNGEKKLKDFFIDEKVPLKLRDRIPLVCDQQGRIIWVVGYRLDDRYKITEETEEVVALEMD
ncbi:MAG: tRNA lysidine(34) synthetase TilS, partial [Halanaerobium sp.]|nr:tRNA lysidine(34) synthetase TilS [Halanaerobium sp.]